MRKLFGRKGQAALEFLTTYGWAFMVILVMIGALAYFGVLNPGRLVKDQCVSTVGLSCKSGEAVLTTTPQTVSISFQNDLGQAVRVVDNSVNISIKGVTVASCNGAGGANSVTDMGGALVGTSNYVQGESMFMFRNCTLTNVGTVLAGKKAGDKLKFDFTFQYIGAEPGEFPHLASGTLTTTAR